MGNTHITISNKETDIKFTTLLLVEYEYEKEVLIEREMPLEAAKLTFLVCL